MLEGVRMLIDRMESHPEDFVYLGNRDREAPRFQHISSALDRVLTGGDLARGDPFIHLTTEEKTALLLAYRKMQRQAFTAGIIATLFDPEPPRKRILTKQVASAWIDDYEDKELIKYKLEDKAEEYKLVAESARGSRYKLV